ncbi:hypothetical protein DFH06DRAFT_1016313 [Mycena polygramma]|nr:hypothetical protein DFH06DRAFT_1016313 [Mycena polygramma]
MLQTRLPLHPSRVNRKHPLSGNQYTLSFSKISLNLIGAQYRPVKKFKDFYRHAWLDEIVRGEGRGDHAGHPKCVCGHADCSLDVSEVRCKDCHGCELLAAACMVREHSRNPLHRMERWNWGTGAFESVSLKTLGLRFYIGREVHPDRVCPRPRRAARAKKEFVVIDDFGLHYVDLYYCDCGKGQSLPVQLLRIKWLPSTGKRPGTAATFNVLRRYHGLSLESKCSMSEFYNSLARQTNNTGEPPPSRYQEFMNMTREWRNLQLLKRAGRAHETDGIAKTKEGGCALECPACPHPGRNLPPEWKDVPPESRFLYGLFLALDANFRMQRKDVSSEDKDPDLGNGLAFFGEVKAYMAHLEENWKQEQPKSTCVAHDAVNTPDKEVRGTASSGIATVDCARHNMKRPRGVGDLQAGERYLNMDYMFFMSLADSELQEFFVSYDIACQWHKNIWGRMQIYPKELRVKNGKRFFVWLVPKWHLPAHIESCGIKFSFLLTPYVGQTDGESPERGWSHINRMSTATREMGPHLRREVLDDHFNDWNWKKILAMGKSALSRRISHYVPEMVRSRKDTLAQERTLPKATLAVWREMAETWEANPVKPNPFERTREAINIASVRCELAEEGGGVVRGETESSDMLAQGVQIEEQHAAGLHPTVDQRRIMFERCGKTRRKLIAWMQLQEQFMPEVAVLRSTAATERAKQSKTKPLEGELVQNMAVFMPSHLDGDVPCLRELQEFEFRLRQGQAHQALYDMRHHLLVRTNEYRYKDEGNVHGVKETTRSVTKIKAIDANIRRATVTYQLARNSLVVLGARLGKPRAWEKVLQVLAPEDVRQMPAAKKRRKEARTPISWIWLADGSAANADRNPAMNEALRIEWAKTRALGNRNTEEVDLLEEEMRRVPIFLRWRADEWDALKNHAASTNPDILATRPDILDDPQQREGHDAYATRQAQILRTIATRFEKKWAGLASLIATGREEVAQAVAEGAAATAAETAAEAVEAVEWDSEDDADDEGGDGHGDGDGDGDGDGEGEGDGDGDDGEEEEG